MSDREKEIALYEAQRNRAWHSWFAARGDVSPSDEHTRIFDGGFRMAWELCRAQPAPQPAEQQSEQGGEWPAMPDKFYEGLGWMHAECCAALDRGEDPRTFEVGDMVNRCIHDLQPVCEDEPDIDTCPGCGGSADNGYDRCIPPRPYYCTKCVAEDEI